MEPIAYLAMEIKQRELDSRVLIAAHLLKAGVAVVIGQQWALFANAKVLPPGVILFKTVNHIQAGLMAKCRSAGHLVAATDEEVLVCIEDRCFLEVFSPTAAENCDLFFAQSEFHREVVERAFPPLRGRTQTVGNARVDFLSSMRRESFAGEIQKITDAHAPYILFNTNYGQLNSIWNDSNHVVAIAAKAGLVNVDDPASVEEYKAKWNWEQQNRDEMMKLLQSAIEEFPDKNIVLRPHPGEIADFWEDAVGGIERVRIIPRSNPHPWILGAELVVHTSCTTGLEAALMGKPVVNLAPVPHPTFGFVTDRVNPTFKTWQEAASAMKEFLTFGAGPLAEEQKQRAEVLGGHFAMDDTEAGEKIARGLAALLQDYGARFPVTEQPPLRGGAFRCLPRTDTVKDKFFLEAAELRERLQAALIKMEANIQVKVIAIDDSLFMLMPAV